MDLLTARSKLGVDAAAGPEEVTRAYRVRRSSLHPDKGGDATEFDLLVQAHDVALEAAQTCPGCQGRGSHHHVRGWTSVKLVCTQCGGSGKRN